MGDSLSYLDNLLAVLDTSVQRSPLLISFKRDKNTGNFLVRSAFQTSDQPGNPS